MNVRERFRLAWGTTFGIHVFQMLLAGAFAVPIVANVAAPDVLVRPAVAAWIAAMRLGGSLGEDTLRNAWLPLVAAGLNYPWLSVAWLRALDQPEPFMVHARYALGRYRVAATIAILAVVALIALGVGAAASVYGVHRALAGGFDERTTDLGALAVVLPFGLLALLVVSWQDAAYAWVSSGEARVRTALRLAFAAVGLRLVLVRGALVILQAVVALTAWLAPRLAFGPGAAGDLGVLLVTQIAAVGLTSSRALWLAWLVGRV